TISIPCPSSLSTAPRPLRSPPPRDLHSFPPRRSSDLPRWPRRRGVRLPGAHLHRRRPCASDNRSRRRRSASTAPISRLRPRGNRSEEHTSELQSRENIVCCLLLEKKKP